MNYGPGVQARLDPPPGTGGQDDDEHPRTIQVRGLGRDRAAQAPETVAVIIPTAVNDGHDGRSLVASCLEALLPAVESPTGRAADGRPRVREVILVTQGRRFDGPILERLGLVGVEVQQIDILGPFNFSRKVNAAAAIASSDVLFLLNDDATVEGAEWPSILLEILADTSVGAAGPIILNPDRTLNAAGDTFSRGTVRHVDGFDVRHRVGLASQLRLDRRVGLLSAAALAIRRERFSELNGMDESFPASFGDSEFVLRLAAAGYRLICTPRIVVVHAESSTRDPRVQAHEVAALASRRPEIWGEDPTLPALPETLRPLTLEVARPPLVRVYRVTVKPLIPVRLHRRLWRFGVRRGWIQ